MHDQSRFCGNCSVEKQAQKSQSPDNKNSSHCPGSESMTELRLHSSWPFYRANPLKTSYVILRTQMSKVDLGIMKIRVALMYLITSQYMELKVTFLSVKNLQIFRFLVGPN